MKIFLVYVSMYNVMVRLPLTKICIFRFHVLNFQKLSPHQICIFRFVVSYLSNWRYLVFYVYCAIFGSSCLTFLIGGISFFTCLRKIPCFSEYRIRKFFLWLLPWYALPSTNVEVRKWIDQDIHTLDCGWCTCAVEYCRSLEFVVSFQLIWI